MNEKESGEIVTTHVHKYGEYEFCVGGDALELTEDGSEVLTIDWHAWDDLVARIAVSRETLCPTQPMGRGRGGHKL